ncbi:MAG: DUF1501 domain-containing protein, partial [Planctomycetaceae bacterium]
MAHHLPTAAALSRRDLLVSAGAGLGLVGLASALADAGELAASPVGSDAAARLADPLAARVPHHAPRAKRVIQFFLNGGPSHIDTFDPKPLLERYAGQPLPFSLTTERKTGGALPSPFRFRKYGQSGLEVSELFSHTAAHADSLAVIRSMQAQLPNHEPSLLLMNCGESVQPRPSVGSWILYGLGSENRNLPGFIAMCPGGYPVADKANWQSGFLPGVYQGTFVDPQHTAVERLIENIRSRHASAAIQRSQLDLLAALDAEHRARRLDDRL